MEFELIGLGSGREIVQIDGTIFLGEENGLAVISALCNMIGHFRNDYAAKTGIDWMVDQRDCFSLNCLRPHFGGASYTSIWSPLHSFSCITSVS